MPGTCYGAQDNPQRIGDAEKCGAQYESCEALCAATVECKKVQQ